MSRACYIIGVLCWVFVAMVSASAGSLADLTPAKPSIVEPAKLDSCKKLSEFLPMGKQCKGGAVHSTATVRARTHKDKKLSLQASGAARPPVSVAVGLDIDPLPDLLDPKRRRAHFWQVYATSMRLRN